MPDAHLGKGATVGSVLPTREAIIPAAVGVDIGCGMIAVRTPWSVARGRARGSLAPLRGDIERAIPLSAGKYNRTLTETAAAPGGGAGGLAAELGDHVLPAVIGPRRTGRCSWAASAAATTSPKSPPTSRTASGCSCTPAAAAWATRSRMRHIAIARKRAEREWIDLPDRDLACLEEGTPEFDRYIAELRWAQHFALLNREEMMDRVADCLARHMRVDETPRLERINCHHNFTQHERHFGVDLWVSRKGAIEAKKGQPGLIPGSMGTASYVVSGLGNPESLNSSPHGAGRAYSRTKARKTFTRAQLEESMKGIEWRRQRRLPRRDPRGLQGRRRRDGRREGPGGGAAHAAPAGEREGRLTSTVPRYVGRHHHAQARARHAPRLRAGLDRDGGLRHGARPAAALLPDRRAGRGRGHRRAGGVRAQGVGRRPQPVDRQPVGPHREPLGPPPAVDAGRRAGPAAAVRPRLRRSRARRRRPPRSGWRPPSCWPRPPTAASRCPTSRSPRRSPTTRPSGRR